MNKSKVMNNTIENGWRLQKGLLHAGNDCLDSNDLISFLNLCTDHPAYKVVLSKEKSFNSSVYERWSSLPVIDKEFVMDHYELFLANAGLSAEEIGNHINNFQFNKTLENHLVFHSSGSSGRRSISIYGMESFGRSLYSLYHNSLESFGVKSIAYIGLVDRYNGGNQWMYFMKDHVNVTMIDIFSPINKILLHLAKAKPEAIFTKPNILAQLSKLLYEDQGWLPTVRHLISVGENITQSQRKKIQKGFELSPHNSFSTTETGPIAFQKTSSASKLSLYRNLNYVEILDNQNNPITESGRPGKLVVSNIYNYSFPLLRYDLKDIVEWVPGMVGQQITPVLGRSEKLLHFNKINSSINELVLWKFDSESVEGIQFSKQDEGTLKALAIPASSSLSPSMVENAILHHLRAEGITHVPCIKVEFTEHIAMDPNTSKLKRVI